MTQVNPIWAQVHTVDADGTTTFNDDVTINGLLTPGGSFGIQSHGAMTVPNSATTVIKISSGSDVTSASLTALGTYLDIASSPVLVGTNSVSEFCGLYNISTHQATSGTTQYFLGVHGRLHYEGTGSVVNLTSVYSRVCVNPGGTGAITNAMGYWAPSPLLLAAATITNYYGLLLGADTNQSATIANYYGASIGMPSGGTNTNVALVLGGPSSSVDAWLYVHDTLADPVTRNAKPVYVNMAEVLTGNTSATISNVYSQYSAANTAFNHTGNVFAMDGLIAMTGTGTWSTVSAVQGTVTTPAAVVNGTAALVEGGVFKVQHLSTGTLAVVYGVEGQAQLRASGTAQDGVITSASGVRGTIQSLGTSVTPGVITVARTLEASAPGFGSTGTIGTISGLFVFNQGHAQVTGSSWGIQVAAQSGATTKSWALQTLGGFVGFTVGASIASATSAVWAGFSIPASTATLTGSTAVTTSAGFNLATINAPTISSATANVTNAATLAITGPPTITGGATLTNSPTLWVASAVATVAAGSPNAAIAIGTSGTAPLLGLYWGSGAPTISAPQGSLYLRTDGSTTTSRAYINTTGSTTWTPITTSA